MLDRVRRWWSGRSRVERMIFAVGVPVAAVAALWGARQDKAKKGAEEQAEATDAEGGGGAVATFVTPGINAGAPGVGFDQIAQFTEVFTGELGQIEQRLEEEFGQSAAERAAAEAANEARFADLEERIGEAADRPPPATPVPPPVNLPAPPGTKPPSGAPPTPKTYTVVRGDTLSKIGGQFGVRWQDIYAANKSVIDGAARKRGQTPSPNLIYPGTVLTIPAK